MLMKVNIFVKKLGKNRKNIEPVCYEYPDSVKTVRDLLTETVRINMEEYKKGHSGELIKVLSKENIEAMAEEGKITFGISYDNRQADFRKAVENACQCLEDGIVVLFADGRRLDSLEDEVFLKENSGLIFIRMTMLAGRIW